MQIFGLMQYIHFCILQQACQGERDVKYMAKEEEPCAIIYSFLSWNNWRA